MAFPPKKNKFFRKGAMALAEFVPVAVGEAFSKFGFAQGDLILHWPDIVGAKLASQCRPIKLQWSASRKRSEARPAELATLVLQVDGGSALEVQHMSGTLLQRVNNHLGWHCVGKITLRQAPLPVLAPTKKRESTDPVCLAKAQDMTNLVEDYALRAALIRLGAQVLAKK